MSARGRRVSYRRIAATQHERAPVLPRKGRVWFSALSAIPRPTISDMCRLLAVTMSVIVTVGYHLECFDCVDIIKYVHGSLFLSLTNQHNCIIIYNEYEGIFQSRATI